MKPSKIAKTTDFGDDAKKVNHNQSESREIGT